MNSQFLAARFDLTANPANTPGGTNYATSGAKNVTINTMQTGGFRNAVSTVTQISNYLAANGGAANIQALYLIHPGDNDVTYANGESGTASWPADPDTYLTQAANDLANAIKGLRDAGAQTIIVGGLAYDYPMNDAPKRALKLLYTNTLWNALTTLGVSLHPATLIPSDLRSPPTRPNTASHRSVSRPAMSAAHSQAALPRRGRCCVRQIPLHHRPWSRPTRHRRIYMRTMVIPGLLDRN